MNKKGFLLGEETVKIVISLIVIALLVVLLSKLYFNSVQNKELEQAKASLENLIEQLSADAEVVTIFNPRGWFILSWPIKNNLRPESCKSNNWKNCICICNKKHSISPSGYKTRCDELGVCSNNPGLFTVKGIGGQQTPIEIVPPKQLFIDHRTKSIT